VFSPDSQRLAATRIRSFVAPRAGLIARGAIIKSSTQNLLVQNNGCSSTQAVWLSGLQMCVADEVADARGPCESTNSKITLRNRSVPMFSVE
jgi:hypothetical protein